ncbi:hypothetical protein K1W69_03975 [Hoeflea sp. WL0058]|uniref:Uncharacterized protein n=1 Tax=Flavimaribacter sediminis TaxID=2865987 RepID=A0AAE3CZV8_9HYPH|nr:hypothetical protein [Flavimaribacter sediminis]MBW8636337.1 hypothetical protein [Flavimaribacter sediminis]
MLDGLRGLLFASGEAYQFDWNREIRRCLASNAHILAIRDRRGSFDWLSRQISADEASDPIPADGRVPDPFVQKVEGVLNDIDRRTLKNRTKSAR